MALAFGIVGRVRKSMSSVRRMTKYTFKEFEEVINGSNTAIRSSIILIHLAADFMGVVAAL